MVEDEEHFNNALSSPQVSGEHTIGIWKECFGSLRKSCMKITNNPRSIKIVLEIIDAAVILHNVLIRNTDTVDTETWLRELDDEFSIWTTPHEHQKRKCYVDQFHVMPPKAHVMSNSRYSSTRPVSVRTTMWPDDTPMVGGPARI
jgi:hypothetical protein